MSRSKKKKIQPKTKRGGGWKVPPNKGKTYPAEVLTRGEVRQLLAQCSRRAPTGLRNKALIALLYRGGLRVSEALALKPKDVDRQAGTVRVLHGKGNKARTVGLDDGALAMVEQWMASRAKQRIKRTAPLFSTLSGEPVKAEYVRAMLKRLATKAGIDKRVHPHGLRHTHAAELAQEGVPVALIQRQLGHSNLGTTSKYLASIRPQQVIEAVQARPDWR